MQEDQVTVWNNCLKTIREHVGEQTFNTWFAPIKPLRYVNKTLTIQVPSQFFYEWLEEHFVYVLRKAIDAEIGLDGQLEYSVVVDNGDRKNKPLAINLPTANKKEPTQRKSRYQQQPPSDYKGPFSFPDINDLKIETHLNDKYSFDTYIEGDCNRLARSAGYAVAQNPGSTSFNPLMIYGGVGLGKTHLVQAIGNEIKRQQGGKFVVYVSSEKFTSQFIEALKNNNVQKFTNFYLQVEALILDDVQFLSGKEKTQEIFFHIFNHLQQSGKQIIMTSDCPPRDLHGLTERLLSRFKWGLTADLQTPDFETRIAIIERKLQAEGVSLPYEVIEYLAYNVDTNIRELEGILISLMAHASLDKQEISLSLAKQILKNIVHNNVPEVDIEMIIKTVARYYNITVSDLKSKTRKKEVVVPRQIAMYLSKEYTKHSLKAIGYHYGGRDHATVIHSCRSVQEQMKSSSEFSSEIKDIQNQLQGKKSFR
uniref:Chromosomal replication initiator protein DnaA n=1 Tax=Roseihalotalea indica TaxID=2867963 RepID=A0AA49JKM7_9BACT|nr:chromosomal replication initiator protein DnaA [Tunicatimonas sp. TK19036]